MLLPQNPNLLSSVEIYYLNSSVPNPVLLSLVSQDNLSVIVFSSPQLYSYSSTLFAGKDNVFLIGLRSGLLSHLQLFAILLGAKIFRIRITFFHECCAFFFDFIIHLLKPKGRYYPNVYLCTFNEVPLLSGIKHFGLHLRLFMKLGISKCFAIYRSCESSDQIFYCIASKFYPPSISCFSVAESRYHAHTYLSGLSSTSLMSDKILFVLSEEVIPRSELIAKFQATITLASHLGFKCFTKDHPRASSRLNHSFFDCLAVHTDITLESCVADFAAIVGVASVSLVSVPASTTSISIAKMFSYSSEDLDKRLLFLQSLDLFSMVHYPATMTDFSLILNKFLSQSSSF
jgi:hypothetical protein